MCPRLRQLLLVLLQWCELTLIAEHERSKHALGVEDTNVRGDRWYTMYHRSGATNTSPRVVHPVHVRNP